MERGQTRGEILAGVKDLCRMAQEVAQEVVVVTHEVGSGVIPPTPLGRAFSDILGEANQILAAGADEVYAMTAGIPQKIK
jgi:adenosylcobinamide kinase/adenosylcobinamide-phosphate guanylyltransferase